MTATSGFSKFREELQAHLREFVETSQRGGRDDRHAVESAVEAIYSEFSLPPPKIVWCENIFQLINLPLLTVLMDGADWVMIPQLANLMRAHCTNPLFESLLRKLPEEASQLEREHQYIPLGHSLQDRLSKRFESIAKEIVQSISYSPMLQAEIEFDWLARYLNWQCEAIAHMISLIRSDTLFHELSNLFASLPIAIQDTLLDGFENSSVNAWGIWVNRLENFFEPWQRNAFINIGMTNRSGTSSLPQLTCLLMAYEIGCKLSGTPTNHMRPWLNLFRGGFAFQFFENYCFICQYPIKVSVDSDMRLHNGEGPAIKFAGNEKLYCWHGTFIPAQLVQRRYTITPWLIDREANVERRRVMVEIYGMEKYLRVSKARIVHQDHFGVLYRKNYSRGEPLVVVSVINATAEPDGTHRRYMLRVPPTMRTARDAVAWTFGVEGKMYDPQVEA